MEAGNGTAISSDSRYIAGRKEGARHVARRSDSADATSRSQYPFFSFRNRMRSWWTNRAQQAIRPMIPEQLLPEEKAQYETLIEVVEARPAHGTKPPRVVVITDLAKDYDDLAAMVVLKELDRLGVVKLLGFIANLMPANRRTQFGRGALDLLDLRNIPIAEGTSGFPDSTDKKHKILDYEFDCDFMVDEHDSRLVRDGKGETLLYRLCSEAVTSGQKLTLLLISSLEDIYTFSQKYPKLLKDAVSNIVLQGGYTISAEGKLVPDEAANNNRYDMEAAKKFHTFMQDSSIPSVVYTKVAAFATPLTSDLFAELEKTQHPLGQHLRAVQVFQDLAFYKTASKPNPKDRFAPFMDQEWFLKNRTSWFDKDHPPNTRYPEDQEVVPYLTKVIVYDALAALGTSGPDAIEALKVLVDNSVQPPSIHQIVGFAGPPSDPGVKPEQMALVLSALLKGSLMSCPRQRKR